MKKAMWKLVVLGALLGLWSSMSMAVVQYTVTDLGGLGGWASYAYSINNNGQIVGEAYTSSNQYKACLFDPTGHGHNIDLGALGGTGSIARSINNQGQIVGRAQFAGYLNEYACLFDPTGNGNNTYLGILSSSYGNQASSINNSGQIVGYGYTN